MKKMIVVVGNARAFQGFFHNQLRYLSSEFHVIGVTSPAEDLQNIANREGIEIKTISIERKISLFKDVKSLFLLWCFFIKERPYIVHGNTPKAALIAMVASFLSFVPVRIYMCHGLRYQGLSGKMRKLLMLMERLTCACSTHVVAVSHGVKKTLVHDVICKSKKIEVIHYGSVNGVQPDELKKDSLHDIVLLRRKYNIPENAFLFAFIGRIVHDKGINELAYAFQRVVGKYPQSHLCIVGPDEYMYDPISSEARAILMQNENIHLTGWQSNILPFLSATNVVVLPSYREGLSTVLLEAGALGIPVITTEAVGCGEVVEDKKTGLIISSPLETSFKDFVTQLETSMCWFLEQEPTVIERMGKNAHEYVLKYFNHSEVCESYLKFYKTL